MNQHIPLKDSRGVPIKENYLALKEKFKTKVKSYSWNFLTMRIGSKDFTTGVKQEVESAFVMSQGAFSFWEKPDIGLIVTVKVIEMHGKYPEKHVSPICLPSR